MSLSSHIKPIKRKSEEEKKIDNKREKIDPETLNDNFVKACEQVSKKVIEDTLNRFLANGNNLRICEQRNPNSMKKVYPMPHHTEITFDIEKDANKWLEALQVSFLSITPTQCLSEKVMKNIVEIMMNAHEDKLSPYHITYLICKCQQILSLNIRMHPPCSEQLHKYYLKFLTSPMDLRKKTLTNRKCYGSERGIFNYCINRLQNELSADSKDGPIFNKDEKRPEQVQQKIEEMHWVKARLEIYEMLDRKQRIDRLMAVMHSMAELLKFDLAFHQSRQISHNSSRLKKLLMMELLPQPVTSTNHMNDTCLKIMSIFVYFVHLNYPAKYIKIMSLWVNILAEFLLNREPLYNNICDSYEPGKALVVFADNMYKIMADLPPESILKILERITPAPIKYSIGILHVRKLLNNVDELPIIPILTNFMKRTQWNKFSEPTSEIKVGGKEMPENITPDNILKLLAMMCKNHNKSSNNNNHVYLKIGANESNFMIDRHYVMKILYITFRAYLDNYKVHRLQITYDLLNLNNELCEDQLNDKQVDDKNIFTSTSLTQFITMYRRIYIELKEYFSIIKSLKLKNELPETFCIFEKIIDFNEL